MTIKNQKETNFPENQVMMMLKSMNSKIEIIIESQKQMIQSQKELIKDLRNFKI